MGVPIFAVLSGFLIYSRDHPSRVFVLWRNFMFGIIASELWPHIPRWAPTAFGVGIVLLAIDLLGPLTFSRALLPGAPSASYSSNDRACGWASTSLHACAGRALMRREARFSQPIGDASGCSLILRVLAGRTALALKVAVPDDALAYPMMLGGNIPSAKFLGAGQGLLAAQCASSLQTISPRASLAARFLEEGSPCSGSPYFRSRLPLRCCSTLS